MFHTTGVMLSKHNIAYLSGLCNEIQQRDAQITTEKMKNYLKRKKYNHMVLYHDGKHNELWNICDNSSTTQCMDLSPEEKLILIT